LFERATARLPEPPTRQAVLEGLWSLRDDTLGGLTQPLTFTRGRPAQPRACWFNMTIRDRRWISPDQFALHCR
jgi:branched-chain amino acid transport system substrate-binding protein